VRKQVATLAAVGAVLAGCGSGVEGSPVAAERWDPCSITPEAIGATGLDPDYRNEGWGKGVSVPDWARCEYMPAGPGAAYALSVLSSADHTITEARADADNREGRDVVVGTRDGYLYRTEDGPAIRDCRIAFNVPPGVVVFTVLYQDDDDVDACEILLEHVHDLEGAVPPAPK
jgi:Protein of unknown function (DUF3558)